jgi:hypothetical protein
MMAVVLARSALRYDLGERSHEGHAGIGVFHRHAVETGVRL